MLKPLEIKDLIKDYGSLRAVDKVSLTLEPREIFGLLGPNGAGKTSIISTLVTLEKPTSGEVRIFGYDVTQEPRQAKVMTGHVPQELINHGFFDVEEILKFHSGYYGLRRNKERIDYLMNRLKLWEHRHKKVKQLSGGMKRRLLIAKALVHSPKLLLLDEPTAGVDIELRTSLWEFVSELKNEGITVLLTTHYLEEAESLCDRVGILRQGQLRLVGTTRELVKKLTNREVRFFVRTDVGEIQHPLLVRREDGLLVFRIPAHMNLGDLLADLKLDVRVVTDLQISEGNLEDAFRSVLGGVG